MNKTININLGGFFFHIDESAYHKLNRYLEAISRSLSDDPQGKNEIISDIEARISELLSEKIIDARQVVNENDIDDIINIMGQPEDYAEAEEGYTEPNYSNQRKSSTGKKLYRDGDDKFLGGVASGIAHYFEVDPIWIRLGMVALFFGAGFGFLVYIILWILLPEAKTTAEKLQMEGEPVNIDNIEKKIREEFTNVSENIRTTANKASEKLKDGANEFSEKVNQAFQRKPKRNNGFEDFLNALGNIFVAIFKVIGKFIGVILILTASVGLISLLIGVFSIGSLEILNFDEPFFTEIPFFFFESTIPYWVLATFTFILIGVPILLLLILGLRILSSNVKQLKKTVSLTLLGIWLVALFGMIFTGIEFGTSHAYNGSSIEKNNINLIANDTLSVSVINDDAILYKRDLRRSSRTEKIYINDVHKLYSNEIRIDVKSSETGEAYIKIRKFSDGENRQKATKNASQIDYKYTIENGKLILNGFYISEVNHLFKDEGVYVTLYLPENIVLRFEKSAETFLYRVDNKQDIRDSDMVNHYFLMNKDGLNCTDCLDEIEAEVDKKIE